MMSSVQIQWRCHISVCLCHHLQFCWFLSRVLTSSTSMLQIHPQTPPYPTLETNAQWTQVMFCVLPDEKHSIYHHNHSLVNMENICCDLLWKLQVPLRVWWYDHDHTFPEKNQGSSYFLNHLLCPHTPVADPWSWFAYFPQLQWQHHSG